MPSEVETIRDKRDVFAAWLAAEDHFGALPSTIHTDTSGPNHPGLHTRTAPARQSTVTGQEHSGTIVSQEVQESHLPAVPPSVVIEATTHTLEQGPLLTVHSTHLTDSAHHTVPNDLPPNPQPQAPQQPANEAPSQHRRTRTRSQVSRDSFNILWREYLALTANSEQSAQPNRGPNHSSAAVPGAGGSTSSPASAPGAHTPQPTPRSTTGPSRAPTMAMPSAGGPHTIMKGPLIYEEPQGLAAILIPILCPPVAFIDLQRLTTTATRKFIDTSGTLAQLSFVLVPLWLWLVRHELLLGHAGDALAVVLLGALFFWAVETAKNTSETPGSPPIAPVTVSYTPSLPATSGPYGRANLSAVGDARPMVNGTVAVATSAGAVNNTTAAPAVAAQAHGSASASAPTAPASSNPAPPPPPQGQVQGAPAAASAAPVVVPNGGIPAVDPLVRKVKQRIIRLEHELFGNELTEADISPDALHSRVRMLCTEVGVPFGGPGGSSSWPSVAELEQQLQAVEQALGI